MAEATELLHIIGGNMTRKTDLKDYRNIGIMAHIDIRQQQRKEFFITLAFHIRLVKYMVQQQWIG